MTARSSPLMKAMRTVGENARRVVQAEVELRGKSARRPRGLRRSQGTICERAVRARADDRKVQTKRA
jgi:hypothetical protein